jgi:hypothetical protein
MSFKGTEGWKNIHNQTRGVAFSSRGEQSEAIIRGYYDRIIKSMTQATTAILTRIFY